MRETGRRRLFCRCRCSFRQGKITGVDFDSTQGDKKIVDIIEQFGAKVERGKNEFTVYKSKLHGIETDASDIPDMVPALAVAGAYAEGTTVIKGAERLRLKESDRIESVTYNLKNWVQTLLRHPME